MTPGEIVIANLRQIAGLAADLPGNAKVVVEWATAQPDLMLLLAVQEDGHLTTWRCENGVEAEQAQWVCGRLVVRAFRVSAPRRGRGVLKLVRP